MKTKTVYGLVENYGVGIAEVTRQAGNVDIRGFEDPDEDFIHLVNNVPTWRTKVCQDMLRMANSELCCLRRVRVKEVIPFVQLVNSISSYSLLGLRGNSVNKTKVDKEKIENADMLVVRQQATANGGDFVIALIEGEATIERFTERSSF